VQNARTLVKQIIEISLSAVCALLGSETYGAKRFRRLKDKRDKA
jgi:hypothetical protein